MPSSSERRGSEKKKRVKMADLRAFVETKMFSKSEKNLEKVGLDTNSANGKNPLQHAVSQQLRANQLYSNTHTVLQASTPA